MIKASRLFSFFVAVFLIEIQNMFSLFLPGHKNSCESLRELKKAVETLANCLVFPQHFLFSQTFTHVSTDGNMVHYFFLLLKGLGRRQDVNQSYLYNVIMALDHSGQSGFTNIAIIRQTYNYVDY